MVEDNIYSGRDNDAVRQALGQVVTSLQTQAKRVYTSSLASFAIFKSYRKKVFMDMVAKARNLFVREICSNVCLVNAFQRTLREILWITTVTCV